MARRDKPWPRYERNVEGAWYAIEDIRTAVEALRQADVIAEKVTDALVERREKFFTRTDRLVAGLLSTIIAVSSVVGMIFAIKAGTH